MTMVLNQVESGRLRRLVEQLGSDVTESIVLVWLWLRCAEAGTPGLFTGGAAEVGAAFGWGADFTQRDLQRLADRNKVLCGPGYIVLPDYLRLPADAEEARVWAHHVWELERAGHAQAAKLLDEKIRHHLTGARSLRRAYEQAR